MLIPGTSVPRSVTSVKDMDSFITFAKRVAKQQVSTKQDDIGPALFVFTQNEISMYCPSEIPKEHFKAVFSQVFKVLGVAGYILCTYGWMAVTDPKSAVSKLLDENQLQISDLPLDDRTEVIWLVGCERGKNPISFIAKVQGGDKHAIGEWKQVAEIDGRLVIKEW